MEGYGPATYGDRIAKVYDSLYERERDTTAAVDALTRLAGWTAYDTGAHGLAQRYLFQAFRLAKAAGDKPLCGRILAGMSHQANFLGHYEPPNGFDVRLP